MEEASREQAPGREGRTEKRAGPGGRGMGGEELPGAGPLASSRKRVRKNREGNFSEAMDPGWEPPQEDAVLKKGKSSSPRKRRLLVPEVPGGGLRSLRGGGATSARRPRSSGRAEGGAGRLRVAGPY